MSEQGKKGQPTLCWDCSKATGGCPWADYGRPVKGWTAREIQKSSSKPYLSYVVYNCPLFDRDAMCGGLKRYKKGKDIYEQFV